MFGRKKYLEEKVILLERKNKALEEHKEATDTLLETYKKLIAAKDDQIVALLGHIEAKDKLIALYENIEKGKDK